MSSHRQLEEITLRLADRQIVFATWLGIGVNVLLTVLKAVVGVTAHSQALLADAAHSASDIIGSAISLWGVHVAKSPPDADHPYGHGKAEHVASLVVSMLLVVVGVQIAGASFQTFFGAAPPAPGMTALPVILAAIVVKEILFHYKQRLGQRHKSEALITEAWHHRSDAYSSVAAFIGIGAALAGERFALPWLLYADPAAGFVVAMVIIRMGFILARRSSSVVMEQVLDEKEVRPYAAAALTIPGVLSVDQLHARSHGRYVVIDIKIGVNAHSSVDEGHEIAVAVRQHLCTIYPEVEDVLVHVNPRE